MTDYIFYYNNIMQGANNHNNTQSYKVLNILISIIILKLFSSYSRVKEVKLRFWFSEWLISIAKKSITVNIIKEIEVKTIVPE